MLELPVRSEIRARFAEMDPYGHVNHAMYFTYLEQGRAEALEAAELSIASVAAEGFQFVITEVSSAKFLVPITAKEPVVVHTTMGNLRRVSGVWIQRILSPDGETTYFHALLKAGVTDSNGRPAKPPQWIHDGLSRLVQDGD